MASIKQLIIDQFITQISALVPATVKKVERGFSVEAISDVLPMIMVNDGEEKTVDFDQVRWTCRFPINVDIVYPNHALKDDLVMAAQIAVEADLSLSSLGAIVNGGDESPLLSSPKQTTHRTRLAYTVEYTRLVGDPGTP